MWKSMTDSEKEQRIVAMRVNIPEGLRNLLKAKSAKQGKSMNEAMIELIDDYVEDEKPKK
jgi:predicted HicB family RNase H-like nuclease